MSDDAYDTERCRNEPAERVYLDPLVRNTTVRVSIQIADLGQILTAVDHDYDYDDSDRGGMS
jgi:hypothetical protein